MIIIKLTVCFSLVFPLTILSNIDIATFKIDMNFTTDQTKYERDDFM